MSAENITGRDGYIIAQALYVAAKILRTQKLPALNDVADMEAILATRFPDLLELFGTMDLTIEYTGEAAS